MVQIHKLSISHACRVAQISRTKFYYQKIKEDDAVIIDALNAEVDKHPRYGFWALFERLRRNGHCWNHKRVYRIYRALGLNLKRRTEKRIPDRIKQPLEELKHPNTVWSMDFVSDALYDGRRFRMLTIIDEFNREALDIEIDTILPLFVKTTFPFFIFNSEKATLSNIFHLFFHPLKINIHRLLIV